MRAMITTIRATISGSSCSRRPNRGRALLSLVGGTLLLFAACATNQPEAETTTSSIPLVETTTTSTLAPAGAAEFPDLGLQTVVPSEWVLSQEDLAQGSAAMLYDAGDTAALVILGRVDELEEPVTETDPTEIALAVSRRLAGFFFDEGTETVTTEAASVEGAEAGAAQIRLDHDDGSHTVTRTTVVVEGAGARYATLLYQSEFPDDRIAQGLEVLERLALLE
jgi:hypothetical protein